MAGAAKKATNPPLKPVPEPTEGQEPSSSPAPTEAPQGPLKKGSLVNLCIRGQNVQKSCEVLWYDNTVLKVTVNPQKPPHTSTAVVPWTALDFVGVVNE